MKPLVPKTGFDAKVPKLNHEAVTLPLSNHVGIPPYSVVTGKIDQVVYEAIRACWDPVESKLREEIA